jgi:hypothetical protein
MKYRNQDSKLTEAPGRRLNLFHHQTFRGMLINIEVRIVCLPFYGVGVCTGLNSLDIGFRGWLLNTVKSLRSNKIQRMTAR